MRSQQMERKKRAQTTKTIFAGENNNGDTEFKVKRNASSLDKKYYAQHFRKLQVFLQFYKEKLMLTKKV